MAKKFFRGRKTPYGKTVKEKKPKPPEKSPYSWILIERSYYRGLTEPRTKLLAILRSKGEPVKGINQRQYLLFQSTWYLNVYLDLFDSELQGEVMIIKADIRDRSVRLVGTVDLDRRDPTLKRPPVEKVFFI